MTLTPNVKVIAPTPEPKNAEFTENLRTGSRIAAVPQLTETQPVNLTSSQPTAKPNRTVSLQTAKQHSSGHETSNKSKVTVIGNSMVRNTGEYISSGLPGINTFVYSKSGLSVNNATLLLPEVAKNHSHTDSLVFYLGSVDIKYKHPLDIAFDYTVLLDKVRVVSPQGKIMIPAVPYRMDDEASVLNSINDQLNKALRLPCALDAKFTFINVNPTHLYKNYMNDGLHFNHMGCQSLAKSFVDRIKKDSNFQSTDVTVYIHYILITVNLTSCN